MWNNFRLKLTALDYNGLSFGSNYVGSAIDLEHSAVLGGCLSTQQLPIPTGAEA